MISVASAMAVRVRGELVQHGARNVAFAMDAITTGQSAEKLPRCEQVEAANRSREKLEVINQKTERKDSPKRKTDSTEIPQRKQLMLRLIS